MRRIQWSVPTKSVPLINHTSASTLCTPKPSAVRSGTSLQSSGAMSMTTVHGGGTPARIGDSQSLWECICLGTMSCVSCVGYCNRGEFEASKDAILSKIVALPATTVASATASSKPLKGECECMALGVLILAAVSLDGCEWSAAFCHYILFGSPVHASRRVNQTGASRRRWDAFYRNNNVADTGAEEPMCEVRIYHLIHYFRHTALGQAIGSNRARGSLTATNEMNF